MRATNMRASKLRCKEGRSPSYGKNRGRRGRDAEKCAVPRNCSRFLGNLGAKANRAGFGVPCLSWATLDNVIGWCKARSGVPLSTALCSISLADAGGPLVVAVDNLTGLQTRFRRISETAVEAARVAEAVARVGVACRRGQFWIGVDCALRCKGCGSAIVVRPSKNSARHQNQYCNGNSSVIHPFG